MFKKTIYKKNKKLTLAIDVEPVSEWSFKITNFYHSYNGSEFVPHAELFKNNKCVFVLSRKYNKANRLLLNNKPVKTDEYGTMTCYELGQNVIIPCCLLEDAITICKN